MPNLMDENRDFRKQIGCMNGISQLFDRHHYLTSWRISSHNNKKLLLGTQYQLNTQHTARAAVEKVQDAQQQLKQRVDMDSYRTSYLSSSCSSTLSSLDSPDVVKGSMYREARCLPVKIQTNDKSRGHIMKHIDSPRPMQQHKSGKPEATASEGSTRFLAKFHESKKNSKDAPLTLARFSYDGRESRETFQSTTPRLSLDSKASSMKRSLLESRSNLLSRDYLQMEGASYSQLLSLKQEPGSQNRSSGVVAKLMGLDDFFPETISAKETKITKVPKETLLSKSSTSKQNQSFYSPRASQNNPTSPSPRLHSASSIRKPTEYSRFPMEPAPWRQQNPTQGGKAPTITQHLSSSVYGEIERRVTELEFNKSGKDLRALTHVLQAMKKTRERLENQSAGVTSQRRCNLEESLLDQNSSLSMWQNSNNYHQVPSTMGPGTPKHSVSYIVIKKPTEVIAEKKLSSSNQLIEIGTHQRIQTQDLKHKRENSCHRHKGKNLTPASHNLKYTSKHPPSIDNRTTRRTIELAGTLKAPQLMNARLRQNLPKREGKSTATVATSSNSGSVKSHSKKKIIEKGLQNKDRSTKSKYLETSDGQSSDFSSETRFSSYQGDSASVKSESNNSLASQIEPEVISLAHSIDSQHQNSASATFIDNIPEDELAVTMHEQPSPVSVLDSTYYGEDLPSPVKKISTAFLDQSPSPDEANWNLESLNNFIDCPRSDQSHMFNVVVEQMEPSEKPRNQRKIVFDMVNEILVQKVFGLGRKRIRPRLCRMPGSKRISTGDMMYQSEYSGEIPALVLDIERQIFKDLVHELVSLHPTKKQLFTMY